MSRISRHQLYMQIAEVVSRRSTCFRRNVGAVIVEDKNIVSIGYNGPASGEPHCTGNGCAGPHGCTRAIHAEVNALDRYDPYDGIRTTRVLSMYVTESPCAHCALAIVDSPVAEVFFLNQYRLTEGLDILTKGGVMVWRMTPSGYIIDYRTGELVELS
jgi:dCMP deaminase